MTKGRGVGLYIGGKGYLVNRKRTLSAVFFLALFPSASKVKVSSVVPRSHTITRTNPEERSEPYRAPPPTQESTEAVGEFVLVPVA